MRRSRAVAVLWDGHMLQAMSRIAFVVKQCYRELILEISDCFCLFVLVCLRSSNKT